MIPNRQWFPTNLQQRAAWYSNFQVNISAIGLTLGLSAGDITQIENDAAMMTFLATTAVTLDAYQEAIRNQRKTITEGDVGDPDPDFPADITFSAPAGSSTGIFERLDDYVKRIRVAPAYTSETGALLGIISSSPSGPTEDLPPTIEGSVDPGNVIELKFVKGSSSGIYIETNVDGGGWEFKEKAGKSPAVFSVPQNPGNTPRGVLIRARFLDSSLNPVGDWSKIETVQTMP